VVNNAPGLVFGSTAEKNKEMTTFKDSTRWKLLPRIPETGKYLSCEKCKRKRREVTERKTKKSPSKKMGYGLCKMLKMGYNGVQRQLGGNKGRG